MNAFSDRRYNLGQEKQYQITRTDGSIEIVDIDKLGIAEEGSRINAAALNPIVDHVNDPSIHVTAGEIELVNRRITRIEAYLDLDSRGVSGAQARFVDTYDGEDDAVLKLDQTKTYATAAITASEGTVVVPVVSTIGFAVGQEVTICDDQQFEERYIWAVGVNTLTFGMMLNNYKKGAYIARSTLERDTVARKMRIGSWGTSTVTISEL